MGEKLVNGHMQVRAPSFKISLKYLFDLASLPVVIDLDGDAKI